jgi:hypothetical protein
MLVQFLGLIGYREVQIATVFISSLSHDAMLIRTLHFGSSGQSIEVFSNVLHPFSGSSKSANSSVSDK